MSYLRNLPISARLALLTATSFVLLLVLVGAVLYTTLGIELREDLDDSLAVASDGLVSRVEAVDEVLDADDLDDREEAVQETDGAAQLLTTTGEVLAESPAAVGLPPLLTPDQLDSLTPEEALSTTVVRDGATLRVRAVGTGDDVAVVATDTASIGEAQRALLGTYGPTALLATLLAALAGYVIARRGLAPIGRMTTEADAFGDADLGRRLSLPARNDEVRRLGTTLNGMLARLDAAVRRERAFTADASHELRTPLAILRAELDLAARHVSDPAVRGSIDSALEEVDLLAELVEDLLLLARADAHRLTNRMPLDLGELAGEVVRRFAPLAEASQVTLRTSGDAVVDGEARALRRALSNLVDNALRHTPPGGTVEVAVTPTTDGGALVRVKDTGPGVDAAALPHLFERFFRVDGIRAEGGSAGIGLAIVAAVATAHHGRVRAASPPDGGFSVTLEIGTSSPSVASAAPG